MQGQHTEQAFETAIEDHLITAGGYVKGDRDGFDQHRPILPAEVPACRCALLLIGVVLNFTAATGGHDVRPERCDQ